MPPKKTSKGDRNPKKRARIEKDDKLSSSSDSDSSPHLPKATTKRNQTIWVHFSLKKDWIPISKEKRDQYPPAICNHCNKEVTRTDGNTTNMIYHLRSHPSKFEAYQKALKAEKEEKVRKHDIILNFIYVEVFR
jgi:hypothetical protein